MQTENLRTLILFSMLTIALGACSTLGGKDNIVREVELSENSNRSEPYMEALRKHSKVIYYYEDYQLRLGIQGVWLSDSFKNELKKEMDALYGNNYPPAADSALGDLTEAKNCSVNLLIQAWDDIYRENPLERKPRSLEITKNSQIPYSIRRLNDLGGIETEFFPFKSFWGQWHQVCFSEKTSANVPEIEFSSPTGKIKLAW